MVRALVVSLAILTGYGCQSPRPPLDPFLGEQRIPPPGTAVPQSSTPYYQGPPPPGSPPGSLNPAVPPAGSYPLPQGATVPQGEWQAPGQSALTGGRGDLAAQVPPSSAAGDRVQVPGDRQPLRDGLQFDSSPGHLAQTESPVTGPPQASAATLGPSADTSTRYVAPFGLASVPTPPAAAMVVCCPPVAVMPGWVCCPPSPWVDPCCQVFAVPSGPGSALALREITDLPQGERSWVR